MPGGKLTSVHFCSGNGFRCRGYCKWILWLLQGMCFLWRWIVLLSVLAGRKAGKLLLSSIYLSVLSCLVTLSDGSVTPLYAAWAECSKNARHCTFIHPLFVVQVLCIQGFLTCRKHAERIILLVEMMQVNGIYLLDQFFLPFLPFLCIM